ncbi:MAG: HAD family hydrolase [Oscillospiraceae bacterium]|nr:HAD family hydrolase [Oscillospiraceae bacterium]
MEKMCIFDLDGTLINSLPAISHFANIALNSVGLGPIDTDTYRYYVGDGMDTLLHRCLAHYNADTEENFSQMRAVYKSGYDNDVLYDTRAYDGIPELLDELKKIGVKICVLSNKPDNAAVCAVDKLFGKNRFDLVIGQVDGQRKKPAPDGVFSICDRMGISPGRTVFVGDTNVDILTGKNAGAFTVGVLWGYRDEKELRENGADKIISYPSELIDIITGI